MPIHPAVVRIYAAEKGSQSIGSGTLIDVREQYGLVITNWHVIRDATGEISVVFPDGFYSAARVVKSDQDWDLAALSIWRPKMPPVRISNELPKPRDLLTIAGYGSDGIFRAVTGPCTQYLAPSAKHPHEIIELGVSARQGDSGGPIFNSRGELSGVLFGSAGNTTAGSYGGRVLQFLEPLLNGQTVVATPAVAQSRPTGAAQAVTTSMPVASAFDAEMKAKVETEPSSRTIAPLEPVVIDEQTEHTAMRIVHTPVDNPLGLPTQSYATTTPSDGNGLVQAFLGHTPIEQAKAALSIIGLGTLVVLAFRLGKSSPPPAK
jgi:hypothetical protein